MTLGMTSGEKNGRKNQNRPDMSQKTQFPGATAHGS
jgi:hypothetical protein